MKTTKTNAITQVSQGILSTIVVRNKMERTQVNNNSNFITIHSMKYLQAQKTYETYLQHLIETKLYLSETNLSYSQRCSMASDQKGKCEKFYRSDWLT